VWGLPQAGILANKRLCQKLAPLGYFKHVNTLGLWYHESRQISFTLVVNDFGVKYVNKADVDHLVASIKSAYTLTEDWNGNLYCRIALAWDYDNRTVDILMLGCIKRNCKNTIMSGNKRYKHVRTHWPLSNSAWKPNARSRRTILPPLDKKGIKRVQQIVGSILYYARVIDMTVSMALITIAIKQMKATEKMMVKCTQLLDHLAYHADAKVRFYASDMIMNIHSDASYLFKGKARSRTCGHFFMGWLLTDD
jgi:hypothetical protein